MTQQSRNIVRFEEIEINNGTKGYNFSSHKSGVFHPASLRDVIGFIESLLGFSNFSVHFMILFTDKKIDLFSIGHFGN